MEKGTTIIVTPIDWMLLIGGEEKGNCCDYKQFRDIDFNPIILHVQDDTESRLNYIKKYHPTSPVATGNYSEYKNNDLSEEMLRSNLFDMWNIAIPLLRFDNGKIKESILVHTYWINADEYDKALTYKFNKCMNENA